MKRKLAALAAAEWAAVAAGVCIAAWLLLIKPLIGMADNGDFQRIMGTVGLGYLPDFQDAKDKYFGNFISRYAVSSAGLGGYISTQLAAVGAAMLLSKLFTWSGVFDIRFLAAVYIAVFLAAVYLIIRHAKSRGALYNALLVALAVIIFFDAGYLAYFNSLYGEPASYAFLLLTLGLALAIARSERPGTGMLAGFIAAAAIFAGAKVQNAPSGLLAALLCLRFLPLRSDGAWKKAVLAGTVFLTLFSAAIYLLDPKEIHVINQYQSLFYGVLKDSPAPERDLRELGINPEYAVLKDTNYFTPGTAISQSDPRLQKDVYDKVGFPQIALFYLKHPDRYWTKLKVTAEQAFTIHVSYLGNYEKSSGYAYGQTTSTFTWWSDWKHNRLPHSLPGLIAFFLAYFGVLLYGYRRIESPGRRLMSDIFLFIGALALLQFVVPVIGSGEADLAKHLFLFNVCFDIMAVASVLWLARNAFWTYAK